MPTCSNSPHIDQTYGSPCAALQFKQDNGDKGY